MTHAESALTAAPIPADSLIAADHNAAAARPLLVELLTEELPPKALMRLSEAFATGLATRLAALDLRDEQARIEAFATPRRLAVRLDGVRSAAPAKPIRHKVLPVAVGLDKEGRATPPLLKKLAALGFPDISPDELERAMDGKSEALFLSYTAPGALLETSLQHALEQTLAKLPIPKMMSYQRPDGETVQFVRPAHRLLALHGERVVNIQALGLRAGHTTLGHRFMSSGDVSVAHAADYEHVLEAAHVLADATRRRARIVSQLAAAAGADRVVMPDALVDEVNALVEWPVVVTCVFDAAFLEVPQECLILTMQTNQKYFALTDEHERLRPRFLVVSNIESPDPSAIIEGNQRVVRPRLADAKFFYEQDRKQSLEARLPGLAKVVYHNQLGSQLARTERVVAIAEALATRLGANLPLAARAARLAKTDLLTEMVGEFPELQGTIGAYYARHDGEDEAVARACFEHYQPRFAGDALPASETGMVVALADKLETLVGIWSIGLAPTGDKDPFALRRQALGVVRILIEKALPLSLPQLIAIAYAQFASVADSRDPSEAVYAFCLERLRSLLRERGFSAQEIEAVLADPPARLDEVVLRLEAVRDFAALPEAQALAAANKRITNILKKSAPGARDVPIDSALLREPAERHLHAALTELVPRVDAARAAGHFGQALSALAAIRASVDAFFDDVMVNAEDEALRRNRLALLAALHRVMNVVADISKLAV